MSARLGCARSLLGALLAGVCGCGPAPQAPPSGLSQSLTLSAAEAEFGAEVVATATRIHPRGWAAEPWPEDFGSGAPARRLEAVQRESATSVLEVRRYALRLFTLESELRLSLPAWAARAHDGSAQASAPEAVATLRVVPMLDPADASPYELPADLLDRSRPWWLLLLLASLLAAAWNLLSRSRGRVQPTPEVAAAPDAAAVLSAELRALRSDFDAGALGDREFHERLAEWLRSATARRGVADAPCLSSEELVRAWERRWEPGATSRTLSSLLAACDAVKFARAVTEPAARLRSLDAAERWLGEIW